MFPGYAVQGQNPSTSKDIKKEEEEEDGAFSSFKIAKAAKEKEQKRIRDEIEKKMEEKKDKTAVRRFTIGDSSDDDELTMIVERSESEDENTSRIIRAQRRQRKEADELDKRKRKNREKRNHLYNSSPVRDRIKSERKSSSPVPDRGFPSSDRKRKHKHGSCSDSDSSHRRDKKKNKEKDRDRYLEPSDSKSTSKSKKWDFMPTVGVKHDNPDAYMIDERNPDQLLRNMDRTMERECCDLGQRYTAVMGATHAMNKLFFPAKTAVRAGRLLDKTAIFNDDPENNFVAFTFTEGNAVDISTVRCDKQIELAQQPTKEILSAREEEAKKNKMIAMESDPERRKEFREKELAVADKERKETNAILQGEGKKDEALWMRLLQLEDQCNRLTNKTDSIPANDRRQSILTMALTHLPKSAKLQVEMMKLKKKMNVPIEDLNKEWRTIMNRMPNSLTLWNHRLNEMKHDSKQFTRKNYMDVVDQAASDLRGLLNGTMRSHVPEPRTEEYLIELLALRVRMEMAMGFVERAFSIAQVLIECNKFHPPSQFVDRYEKFIDVWEKNLPLVGEPNGKGWFWYQRGHPITPSEEWKREIVECSDKYHHTELPELGRAALRGEHHVAIFARHERIDEKYNWRPVRSEAGETTEPLERQVEFNDLAMDVFQDQYHLHLVVNLIKELGGLFYEKMVSPWVHWSDPMGARLLSFGLLNPSLHSVPIGLPDYLDRMLFELSPNDPTTQWMYFIPMSTARIRTRAWFIAQRETSFDMSAVLKELADIAAKSVEKWLERGSDNMGHLSAILYIMSVYEALNLFEVHAEGMNQKTMDKSVKTIVKSIISKALIWSGRKRLDRIESDLNRTIVLILTTLLLRLPGSWEERRRRVETVLLGKDAKTESIPIKEQLEIHPMIIDVRERGMIMPSPSDDIHTTLVRFFGSDFVLAAILETFFLHADAAKSSTKIPKTFSEIFDKVHTTTTTNGYHDHYEQFYVYYIYILKHAMNQNQFRILHSKALEHETCPKFNSFITREYINSQQNVMKEVRMLANLKSNAEEQSYFISSSFAHPFPSLARLYANRKQFNRIVASAEMQSDLVIANRVIRVYIEEAKRQQDPLLWRYALNLAAEFKNRKLGEEVFTQAFADCSWSRDLHIDNMEAFPDTLDPERQQLVMVEKDIRLRGAPNLVNTFIEAAQKMDNA